MRDAEHDEGKDKTGRAAERDVKRAADEKRNADGRLHPAFAFTGKPARDDWSNSRADAARREQYADSGRGAFADRKDAFAKHSEKREYAAAKTPGGFDEQQRKHAR